MKSKLSEKIESDESFTDNSVKNTTEEKKGSNAIGALILISAGVIFLLNNFGFLPWSIWSDLWRLWPMFLIFWGLQLIFAKSKIANIIIFLISTTIIFYLLLVALANANPGINEYLGKNFPQLIIPQYSQSENIDFDQNFEEEFELP